MNLKTVRIEGFRSIGDMELNFNENGHKVLVGKNESGKSNILKALNLLSNSGEFRNEDVKELYSQDPLVVFIFNLEQSEINKIRKEFCKKFSVERQTSIIHNFNPIVQNLSIYVFLF